MKAIVNKLLLVAGRFMLEMHLKRPGFTHSAYGPLTKNKARTKNLKKQEYIYQNKLDKASFQRDMAFGDFKDFNRRSTADKVLCDKAFNIAGNLKYDGYQRGLASMI